MSGVWVEIAEDDSVESVAYRHGHIPDTVWNHPENAELRQRRRSMHVLQIGDRVFVPPITPKQVPCATDQRHVFRRIAVPSVLPLRLAVGGEPIANRPCRIELPGRPPLETHTDADGFVEVPVMPDAGSGVIVVELESGKSLTVDLAPRELDPVDTPTGAQARLRNLGFLVQGKTGSFDLATVLAIARFQREHQLEATGTLDDATQAALLSEHGG